MDDLISRQAAISRAVTIPMFGRDIRVVGVSELESLPSAQPEGWMERNEERILQAGMEGREIEFRIGGRLFAIREKAQ